jgi:hypothetical protein
MNRQMTGLSKTAVSSEITDGVYLVRVQRVHYRWHKHKPFYELNFYILEPAALRGGAITACLCVSPKMLWRFAWFLRDFQYNPELLESDELDVRALTGLKGVIQIARHIVRGQSEITLRAFAPATEWERLAHFGPAQSDVA